MILDCSSFESTKKSVIDIFKTNEQQLLDILGAIDSSIVSYSLLRELLYEEVCNELGEPTCDIDVIWFHATRVEEIELIFEHGILTKTKARELIEPRLNKLSKGFIHYGGNPFEESQAAGDEFGVHDEGPFAFLIRHTAINPPQDIHNYHDVPELIENISGELLGENYRLLVDRFKELAEPYVVSFIIKQNGSELSRALLYLKLVIDDVPDQEAADSANTFFNSRGVIVTPDKIISVEKITT